MSSQRRYSEDEIAAIFEHAAKVDAERRSPGSEGLTLEELQDIGEQSGISSSAITQAAARVDTRRSTPPPARFATLPISVARTVDLPGKLTDSDWEELIVDLRDTFHAPGDSRRDGGLRTWKNGNLHVTVDPGEKRDQLRFRTLKGAAREVILSGGITLAFGFVTAVSMLIGGGFQLVDDLVVALLMMLIGVGLSGGMAWSVARWREERSAQFDALADRTAKRILDRTSSASVPASIDSALERTPPDQSLELNAEIRDDPEGERDSTRSRRRER